MHAPVSASPSPGVEPEFKAEVLPAGASGRAARGALISLVAGLGILVVKMVAWQLTSSVSLMSDALESTVNVAAAAFALWAVRFASLPPDQDHPYGHGKAEQLSAAFEGGLVAAAAVGILGAAVPRLWAPVALQAMDAGMVVNAAAGVANLLLGTWLVRRGKQAQSPALVADGHHVLSDVWTTVGVLGGLTLYRVTGIAILDPLMAIILAVVLLRTGFNVVRSALDGLMDAADPDLERRIHLAFEAERDPAMRGLHEVRTIRSGRHVHVDAHVYVPAHWTVSQAHQALEHMEAGMRRRLALNAEIALHLDPDFSDAPAPAGSE